jgi:hypothetical protein
MHPRTGHRTRAGTRPWMKYAAGLAGVALLSACTGQQSPHATGQARPVAQAAAARGAGATMTQAATTTGQAEPQARSFALVTGDQVRLGEAAGRPTVSVRPGLAGHDKLTTNAVFTFDVRGDIYAIPADALPYLGSVLDPRLFDVSYLERAGYAGLSSLPVTVTWRHSSHAAVPGLTAPDAGSQTSGSISTAAGRFGQVLTTPDGRDGLLAQVRRIALAPLRSMYDVRHSGDVAGGAGAAAAGLAGPGVAVAAAVPLSGGVSGGGKTLYTLTVGVRDHDGRPAAGIVVVQNTGNAGIYSIVNVAAGAKAAVNVPQGNYSVEAFSADYDAIGLVSNVSLVPDNQVSVTGDTTLTLDAHTAVPVSVSVPTKGADPLLAVSAFNRASAHGGSVGGAVQMFGPGAASEVPPVHMYVMPTPKPRIGSLGYQASYVLVPRGTGVESPEPDVKYNYYLDFASQDGIPADQTQVLTAQDLATVHENFAAPGSGDGTTTFTTPFQPWAAFATQLYSAWYAPPAPDTRTDYFDASPGTVWQQMAELIQPPIATMAPVASPVGPYETFTPGESTSMTWGASPAVPEPEWQDMGVPNSSAGGGAVGGSGAQYYLCPVCRQGDLLSFNAQLADTDPTHTDLVYGFGDGVLASSSAAETNEVKFYRNGTLAQVSGYSGQVFPLLPGKAQYKIDWSSTANPAWNTMGTRVDSQWTFSSGPARTDQLPSYEYCSPQATQPCSYVPLVFASYDFGAGLTGQVAAGGTHTFTFSAFHQADEAGPPITGAVAQVSFDDGSTWTPAAVTSQGDGNYSVSVSQPAASGYVSVRVTLTDAAGDTLRQTIIRAYALTTSSEER